MITVLAIDDQPGVLQSLQNALALEGYSVITASSGREALERVARFRPEVVLVDLILPDGDGASIAAKIRETLPNSVLVAMSGDGALLSRAKGFDAVLEKPLRTDALLAALKRLGK